MKRVALFSYTFVLLNVAAVVALYNFVRSPRDSHLSIWTKYKRSTLGE